MRQLGGLTQVFTNSLTSAGTQRAQFGFNFVATSPSMLLTIEGVSMPEGNQYLGLDSVSVVATERVVPEPLTVRPRARSSSTHADAARAQRNLPLVIGTLTACSRR